MIFLAADHRGFVRKEEIKTYLFSLGQEVVDVGNKELDSDDDEVDFVKQGCRQMTADLADGKEPRGIFFCGSGVMVDMAANRNSGIRSCLGFDESQVREARSDDDINVLSIAADFMDLEKTKSLVKAFLETPFSGEERYLRRLKKIC